MPSPYLKQCWFIFYWAIRNKFQWNFNPNFNIFIQGNVLENVVCEKGKPAASAQMVIHHHYIKFKIDSGESSNLNRHIANFRQTILLAHADHFKTLGHRKKMLQLHSRHLPMTVITPSSDKTSAIFKIITWSRLGGKPLPEPMVIISWMQIKRYDTCDRQIHVDNRHWRQGI